MHRAQFCLIISVPCRASGTGAAPDEYTELWYGSVLTASFRVAVCVKPDGALRGVVYLKPLTGDVDVYHIYGHLENNSFRATHSSGHLFTGRLTGPDGGQNLAQQRKETEPGRPVEAWREGDFRLRSAGQLGRKSCGFYF